MVQQATRPPVVRGRWHPMSWEGFLDWCDEGQSAWVDGEGIAYAANSALHVRRVAVLADRLRLFVRAFDLGEVCAGTVPLRLPTRPSGRMPDVFVAGRDQLGRVRGRRGAGPPPIGLEYLAADSVQRDPGEKRAGYERAGPREYPVIDARPGRYAFLFLRLDEAGHYQEVAPDERGPYHSAVLPGSWLDPNRFWPDPLPTRERLTMLNAPEAYRRYLLKLLESTEG